MFFTERVGTARSHTSPRRAQTVVPMADLVRQDPRAYVRSKTLLSAPILSVLTERKPSHRTGGFSTDRTVINTDGVPTRPTTEISSYVKLFIVHSSESHTSPYSRPFSFRKNTTAPRSKWPYHRPFTEGAADEVYHWRCLPRAPLHSVCRRRRCGECGIEPG